MKPIRQATSQVDAESMAVYGAVHRAVHGVVDRAIYWAVSPAVPRVVVGYNVVNVAVLSNGAVDGAVSRAASGAASGAVYRGRLPGHRPGRSPSSRRDLAGPVLQRVFRRPCRY